MWLTALLVFLAVALADSFWTLYLLCVEKREAGGAAFWSAMILVCGAFSTISYVSNRWMIVPAILGGAVGTYLVVRRAKKKETLLPVQCIREPGHEGPCNGWPCDWRLEKSGLGKATII